MTLFDLPVRDHEKFESLTGSALNTAKMQAGRMRQSAVIANGALPDFNAEHFA